MTTHSRKHSLLLRIFLLILVFTLGPQSRALTENRGVGFCNLPTTTLIITNATALRICGCEDMVATNSPLLSFAEASQVALPTIGIYGGDSGQHSDQGTSRFQKTVAAGTLSPKLSANDKLLLGLRNLASPVSVAGVLIGAGYSHLNNGQPNYGVDGNAFAQRFGAGMARSASQTIFTTSVLAPVLHEDPRYYVLGSDSKVMRRVLYVVTRPFVTRTDSGRQTVNASLLIGYAGAAALTRTYYPEINRNTADEARTFGSSIGGAAAGFAFDEFSGQLLRALHLKH